METKTKTEQPKFVPAYACPENEKRGAKYNRELEITAIAKLVRADIAAAIKTGTLPKGLKVSVRSESYSMGRSLTVTVMALPAGLRLLNPTFVRQQAFKEHGLGTPRYRPAAASILATLESVVAAYNRDNSDSSVDYFDRSFYEHIRFDADLNNAELAIEQEVLRVELEQELAAIRTSILFRSVAANEAVAS